MDYTLRAPSVGSKSTGSGASQRIVPQSNEWDTMLNKNSGYLRHFDDPVSLHFPIYIVIIDLFQIIGEPFIPHSQQAEEAGLARPLTAHQTQHQFKFDAGVEHPADGTQHENFQALGVELAFFCPQESVQGVWNAELPVP